MRSKQLDQDETIEIMDQTMLNTNIAVNVMSYEESSDCD
jgi:hypothetical protein